MGKTAFLIVDMQNDFCLPGAPFEVKGAMGVARNIRRALEACRQHKLPVVHVFRYYRPDGSDVEITRYDKFMQVGGALIEGTKGERSSKNSSPGRRIFSLQEAVERFLSDGAGQLA